MGKQCRKCGSIMDDNAKFCDVCGTPFANSQQQGRGYAGGYQQNAQSQNQQQYQQNNYQYQQNNYSGVNSDSVDTSLLVDPKEKVIAKMTASPLINFLSSGGLAKTEMFFTEKRLYIKWKEFSLIRGMNTRNDIVELSDISATQFVQTLPIFLLVLAAIEFLLCIFMSAADNTVGFFIFGLFVSGLFVLCFFLMRGLRIRIFFPGGSTALLFRNSDYQSAATFHKQLRLYVEANVYAKKR